MKTLIEHGLVNGISVILERYLVRNMKRAKEIPIRYKIISKIEFKWRKVRNEYNAWMKEMELQ